MTGARATPQLLLIDDDVRFTRLLARYLDEQGFSVSIAHDGVSGLERALSQPWDLVVLDGMLPRLDGLQVLKRLRERSNLPVLMLTARGDESDRIGGLDQGADDYLPKTASPNELVARLRALLRRGAMATAPTRQLQAGELKLDLEGRSAQMRGSPLSLTPLEFDLLAAFAAQLGRVLSRAQLVERLRDRRFEASDRSIDVHVTALRRKLGDDPREPRYIRTVRGAGYLLQVIDD